MWCAWRVSGITDAILENIYQVRSKWSVQAGILWTFNYIRKKISNRKLAVVHFNTDEIFIQMQGLQEKCYKAEQDFFGTP